jgi:hypothetical protein
MLRKDWTIHWTSASMNLDHAELVMLAISERFPEVGG